MGPVPNNFNRIGNIYGTVVGMPASIDGISVPIARIADSIDVGPERIKGNGITTGKIYELIMEELEVRLNIQVGTLGRLGTAALRVVGSDSVSNGRSVVLS